MTDPAPVFNPLTGKFQTSDNPVSGLTSSGSPQVWGDPYAMISLSTALVNLAEDYLAKLGQQAANLVAPVINPTFPTLTAAPRPVEAPLPTLQEVTWIVPSEPPPFSGDLNVGNILPGPFTGTPPVLSFPLPPPPFAAPIPGSPSVNLNFVYPTVSVELPSVPSLLSLDTVIFNPLVIPTFTATVPVLMLNPPNVVPYKEGNLYTSRLLNALGRSLGEAIEFGRDTALPGPVEQALADRAYEREYRKLADALADLDRYEMMGYSLPPGGYFDARLKLQTEFGYVTAGLSRDVYIKQAETTLANIIAAREQATKLESVMIDYINKIAQRVFESTKYATEASIAIYNGQIQQYTASLKAYETMALVYDTQLKGIQAQIAQIQAQIAFEKTKAEINTALVQQYTAEVQAAQTIVDIYKLQLDIIQTEANVEKIKVDIFAQQIAAFTGQVNAYTAQIEAYKALVSTQGVIEDVYKTEVEAYSAQVNAGVAEANALIAVFRGQIEAYTAQLEGYKAAIEGMVGQARAAAEFNTAEAAVYSAESQALSAYNNTLTAQWQAVINEQLQVAQIAVAAAKASGDLYIASEGLALDASKVGAQVAAQLGAAALGAIHWANNSSWAIQFSSVQEQIQSTSTATNTNINESS